MRRLWGYVRRHRRDVRWALAAAVLGSACQTAVPMVEREIVDGVILHADQPLWPWLGLLVALSAAAFGFAYVRRYRGGRVALGVQYASFLETAAPPGVFHESVQVCGRSACWSSSL